MKYKIVHESRKHIRLRIHTDALTPSQCYAIEQKLVETEGVQKVKAYSNTGGVSIHHDGTIKDEILEAVEAFQLADVEEIPVKEMKVNREKFPYEEQLRSIQSDKRVRNQLRKRIVQEAVTDMLLPTPLQILYHAQHFIWPKIV